MSVKLTFTPTLQSQVFNIMTIQDEIVENDERICLRLAYLTEPCPGSVIVGADTEVVIAEDDGKFAIYVCIRIFINISCMFIFIQFLCLHYNAILIQLDGPSIYFIFPLQQ